MNKRIAKLFEDYYLEDRKDYITENGVHKVAYRVADGMTGTKAYYDIFIYESYELSPFLTKRDWNKHHDLLEVLDSLPDFVGYFTGD